MNSYEYADGFGSGTRRALSRQMEIFEWLGLKDHIMFFPQLPPIECLFWIARASKGKDRQYIMVT